MDNNMKILLSRFHYIQLYCIFFPFLAYSVSIFPRGMIIMSIAILIKNLQHDIYSVLFQQFCEKYRECGLTCFFVASLSGMEREEVWQRLRTVSLKPWALA